jgi:hypothetical protein
MNRSAIRPLVRLLLLGAFFIPLGATCASAADALLRLRAFAVNMSGVGGGRAGTIDIVIERWSTDQERERLRDVLVEKGADKLLDALKDIKPRTGYLRTSTSLGWDTYYARETPFGDGGRRIIVATDRRMSFAERSNQPRSVDYEFTLVEIRLDKNGKGQGKYAVAAKISYDKDTRTVEIENYGIEPVRLTEVTVQK